MRILPLAFIANCEYETIENLSSLTHSHERCKIACVLYVEIAKSMLANDLTIEEHVKNSCDKVKEFYNESDELKHFQRIFDNDLEEVRSSGYVINTLECVINALETTGSYRDAVLKSVNFGNDTDTVAAICGGLAGIYYGFDEIPVDWTGQINKIDEVYELCERYEEVINEYF